MFFATLWAFLMGKNAIDNGIKDTKLNNWSRQNTFNQVTNTYIDANGASRDVNSNAKVFMERTLNDHIVKKDIFGNIIMDYTVEKERADYWEAKAKQDQFHTVVCRNDKTFQDLSDPTREYVIQKIYVSGFGANSNVMDIPVYVDTRTAYAVRPIDEYMEFISHNEYYNRLKKNYAFEFYIRDMAIINELIRQKNMTFIPGEMKANWGNGQGLSPSRIISTIEENKQCLERTLKRDTNDKVNNGIRRRLDSNNNVSFI